MTSILQLDKQYVWHPFTHLINDEPPLHIIKGEGAYLIDANNHKLLDATSSWWVNLHGHCNSYISNKIQSQLQQLEHCMFSGITHDGAVNLAARLVGHLPNNQSKIFYSDNGSTAVEVAIKMTLQYFHNQKIKKKKIIAFQNAYHGDTFGGMSVGARNVFNQAFESELFEVIHIPVPTQHNFEQVKQYLISILQSNNAVAGFIFEPLVQGAAGMVMYEAQFLDELMAICKTYKIICIADEVMTGFGRTGWFFASNYLTQQPDIICLSKGLTGGYMPLGVTSCAQFIYQAYLSDDKSKTFFHGHSYTANPLACAAALASLDLMEQSETWQNINMITQANVEFVTKHKNHAQLIRSQSLGVILALEIKTSDKTHYLNSHSQTITTFFLQHQILVRPLGNVLYIIPPYCITKTELEKIYNTIISFLKV